MRNPQSANPSVTDAAPAAEVVDYLEGLMEGFVAYDAHWRMTYMNAAAESLLGRRRGDVLGKTWHAAFPHAVGNPVDRMYQRVMAGRVAERMEYFYPHYGRWLEIGASPLSSGGIGVYFRDVSDRMRAETALRESRERLRLAQGYGEVGVWSWEAGSGALTVEPEMEQLYGVPPGTFVGYETWARYLFPEDRARIEAERSQAIAERRPFQLEYRIRRPDGETRWILSKGRGEYDGSGKFLRALGVNVDITERKRAEEAIRQSEERFAKAFRASPSGLLITREADGTIREANDTFLEIFGVRREEIIGRRSTEVEIYADPADRERALEVLRRDGRLRDYELSARTRGGEIRTVLLSADRIEIGGEPSLLTQVRDITEGKRMERALQEADRRKNEFLATLAHELRNPLAPIRNAVQLLKIQGPAEPSLQFARDIIDRQVAHMVRLIDDLMDVSRITRGKLQLRREHVALAAIVDTALETCRPHLGHELTVSLPSEPVHLDADPVRLAQVFANLLNNASKYTEQGGRIWFTAARAAEALTVRVKDTGIGISPEHLPHLFEMFSQEPAAVGRAQGGLGIGLALAKGLVEMHGGSIAARSEGRGRGSEFIVRLPIAPTPPAPRPMKESERAPAPCRILVVDDNRDTAASLALLLQAAGHEVVTANDGAEALAAAERSDLDVVFLDLGMPQLDGYAVCRRLREHPRGRKLVIVALTGWGQEDDRRRTREAGFDAHLVKPVEVSALEELLVITRA